MACITNHVVRSVIALDGSTTCEEAARLMTEWAIGALGVRVDGRLVGIVTERDLVVAAGKGKVAAQTTIAQVMPVNQPTVSRCATEREAAETMRAHRTRHLAVVDGKEIIGMISLIDLVSMVVEEKQAAIDLLETYIRGGRAAQLSAAPRPLFPRPPEAKAGVRS